MQTLSAREINKLCPGLDFALLGDGSYGGREGISKSFPGTTGGTPGTDLLSSGGKRLLGINCPTTSGSISHSTPRPYTVQQTLMCLHLASANPAATRAMIGSGFDTSNAMDLSSTATGVLRVNTKVSITTRTHDTAAGVLVLGSPTVYAFSYNSGDASPVLYVNGKSVSVTSSGSTTITQQATNIISNRQRVANVNTFGTTFALLHWQRILTPAEVMRLTLRLLRWR